MDNDSKNMSIAAYVLPIGWLYAFFATQMCGLRNEFTVFHLRQALGLNIFLVLVWLLFKVVDVWLLEQFVWVVMVLNIVYSIVAARDGRRKYQLFIGRLYDKWFNFIE